MFPGFLAFGRLVSVMKFFGAWDRLSRQALGQAFGVLQSNQGNFAVLPDCVWSRRSRKVQHRYVPRVPRDAAGDKHSTRSSISTRRPTRTKHAGFCRGINEQRNLTHRANHRHIFSVATIEPAPGTGRGLFESGSGCRRISLVVPHFRCPLCRAGLKEIAMKRALVAGLIAGSLFSFEASAQERAGSAALGAVSGAIVLGPIGAVAGAFIGYSAGPAIAHSWRGGRSASRSRVRREAQTASAAQQSAAAKASPPPSMKAPDTVAAEKTAPPVQGFD